MLAIFTRLLIFLSILMAIGGFFPDPFTAQMTSALTYFAQYLCSFNLFLDATVIISAVKVLLDAFVVALLFVMFVVFLKFTGGIKNE